MQPGKSNFLIYLLLMCLGQKQAVAVEFFDGRELYVLFTDTVTVHSHNDIVWLIQCPTVWVLSDSNDKRKSPSGIFRGRMGHIRIIQTTSPRPERWREWSENVDTECYVMNIWSDEEVVQLA
jgi:hypothetical protein